MSDIWNFVIESNFINFLLFAVVLLILQQKFLNKIWSAKNQNLYNELNAAKQERHEAEQLLRKAQSDFKDFDNKYKKLKEEQVILIQGIEDSLIKDNTKKLNNLKLKYEREISRLTLIAQQDIRMNIMTKAKDIVKSFYATNKDNNNSSQSQTLIQSLDNLLQ